MMLCVCGVWGGGQVDRLFYATFPNGLHCIKNIKQ